MRICHFLEIMDGNPRLVSLQGWAQAQFRAGSRKVKTKQPWAILTNPKTAGCCPCKWVLEPLPITIRAKPKSSHGLRQNAEVGRTHQGLGHSFGPHAHNSTTNLIVTRVCVVFVCPYFALTQEIATLGKI